jgi:hypothetical protein
MVDAMPGDSPAGWRLQPSGANASVINSTEQ